MEMCKNNTCFLREQLLKKPSTYKRLFWFFLPAAISILLLDDMFEYILGIHPAATFPLRVWTVPLSVGLIIVIIYFVSKKVGSRIDSVEAERNQAQKSLWESEEKYRDQIEQAKQDWEDAFNTITDMVTIHDKDFNIIRANKAAEKILGLPFLEAPRVKCFEYYHGAGCPPEGCPSCQCLDTGTPVTVETYEPHLKMFLEIKAIPRLDSSNRIVGLIHVVRDITENKKLEQQLRQAQKMEAVGQLAGGIAHDFNNILTAILGDTYLLLMKMDGDDPLKSYIEDIRGSADKAANLTQSLLTFSRKQIMDPKPIVLNKIIKKIHKLMSRVVGEDIELITNLEGPDLTVMADGVQLEQVLINLINNARDAMPEGGVLTIGTEFISLGKDFLRAHGFGSPGDYVLLSVADTGSGMDANTLEKIFEPFFTTKEVGKGTGLGLSIVYGIIKQHNGYITCYSEPNRGTNFRIYLPVIGPGASETQVMPTLPVQGGETILVAEDETKVRKITKRALEEFGYGVIEAIDGDDAVDKFEKNKDKIQLVLMDVIMPKKNGKEAFEEISRTNPNVKVLFTSGYDNAIIHKKGILDKNFNFIQKPVSPDKLLAKIREILDKVD